MSIIMRNTQINNLLSWIIYWILLSYVWVFVSLVLRQSELVSIIVFIVACIPSAIATKKLKDYLNKEDYLTYERKKKKNQQG
jgi:Na+/melibiose symporter-like transporter